MLEKKKNLLPLEKSGVYRIFSPNTIIDRCAGRDHTGTLYVGMAGEGKGNWSSLRTRISSITKGEHHIVSKWAETVIQLKFPWESLSIEWAYTGRKSDDRGELRPQALRVERLLLHSYVKSFGEYPPWNEKR